MRILIATSNPAKIENYSAVITAAGHIPVSLRDIDIDPPDFDEDHDLVTNARNKAAAFASVTNLPVFATDEGLHVLEFSDQLNQILSTQPRRLGTGRTLSDQEIADWYQHQIDALPDDVATPEWTAVIALVVNSKLRQQSDSIECHPELDSGSSPTVNPKYNIIIHHQSFTWQYKWYPYDPAIMPPLRPGYPSDSFAKAVLPDGSLSSDYVSRLPASQRLPVTQMADWLETLHFSTQSPVN